ncbi:MAG: hypothetical protein A2017_15695 [Lentisphaerae bacterium GWF2_44_16]|nr:MAG: hypothetical protein A2017_15695 [Lentisphaerae bacterium GWF2_44_16]
MKLNFFKNKNDFSNEALDSLHNDTTQIFVKKSPVKKLEAGLLPCSACHKDIDFKEVPPLSIQACPHCGRGNFIPLKIKEYWLYEPVGGGGKGSVYHAFIDHAPDIDVAVKILPRDRKTDPVLIEDLLKEARTGYIIGKHPYLTRVIDFGFADSECFDTMEYVEGLRLDRIIDSPVRRPEKQILLWALQILSAEQHIYERGYLFRDLKPQNIIIDTNGNARLVDYGLAIKIEDAMKNLSDQIEGSPYYIPPERILGESESLCSEIYSLGMVIFHTIAGTPYYSKGEIEELVAKHVTALRINNVAGKLPSGTDPALIEVLNRMICRAPSARYQTYKEAAEDIYKVFTLCA